MLQDTDKSVLLVEETRVPGDKTTYLQGTDKHLSHKVI
jgi:hypothetical protein